MTDLDTINSCIDLTTMSPKDIVERNYDKVYWEEGAKLLRSMELSQIMDIIPNLFEWIQDLNWPGSKEVMELLANLPKPLLIFSLEQAINSALVQNDEEWLYSISIFIKEKYNVIRRYDLNH